MNLSHGLSNLRLLVWEERRRSFSLVTRFWYSILWQFEPEVKTFYQIWFGAGVVWCFTAIYFQAFLPKNHVEDCCFLDFDWERKWGCSASYRADNVEVKSFFVNSPTYWKRSPLISDRNSSIDFFYSDFRKRQNARTRCWLCFSFTCLWSGAKTFPSRPAEHVFVTRVGR